VACNIELRWPRGRAGFSGGLGRGMNATDILADLGAAGGSCANRQV
jgi:hypothetical protein